MRNWRSWIISEKFLLFFLIILYIFIRSLHFAQRLDFSTDQATSSQAVLEMMRNHHLVLIGPRFTLEYHGRYMFFGPAPYYFQAIFLMLGHFDPIVSSYIFMLFSSLMVIPLYFGVKSLIDKRAAIFMSIIFVLLRFFINYSGFLWNPNFQFVLLSILLWFMGWYKKHPSIKNFFWVFFSAGILLEFHYIFILIIFGLFIYYFLYQKNNWRYFIIGLLGILLGNLPIIIFDLRNQFYNLQTVILFITHWKEVLENEKGIASSDPHYFLPLLFFSLLILVSHLKKYLTPKILLGSFVLLLIWALAFYLPTPSNGYGMSPNWSYSDELKAEQIIIQNRPINFNVTNLIYDPQAAVQKYLLEKDQVQFNNDYLSNDYLFVLSAPKDYLHDPAFEIKNLQPAEEVESWKINDHYNLYLAHRLPKDKIK